MTAEELAALAAARELLSARNLGRATDRGFGSEPTTTTTAVEAKP